MVLTTIRTVALPVEEVEFPSVTICAQGKPLENAHGKLEMLVSFRTKRNLFF